jgi:acyl-CoA synthetase (AMP-forming)/AMP-acid ligase II
VIERQGERSITFGELFDGARQYSKGMISSGLKPGERVAIMLQTSVEYLLSYFGALLAGLVPAMIAPPFLPRKMDVFVKDKADQLAAIEAAALITSRDRQKTAAAIQACVPTMRHVLLANDLHQGHAQGNLDHLVAPQHIAMIQFSSGSNGRQKGVALTHANLISNIRAVHLAMGTTREDVIVVWLPLYHDMGLLGCVCQALFAGAKLVLMSPTMFIGSPPSWLRIMSERSGTIGVAPNFGYQLCVDRAEDLKPGEVDLSKWRMALNGSEMVTEDTISRFVERFGPFGFRRETFMPVYGLAEATVAVCFTPPGTGAIVDRVNLRRLVTQGVAESSEGTEGSSSFVSVGKPIPGVKVKIVDHDGRQVDERVRGELLVRSSSVMAGYLNNATATEEVLVDGWLYTGDLAYRVGEHVFVTGRSKDVIIKAGRNYIPEHFEQAASSVPGVRKYAVAAFGVLSPLKGTEDIVVLAETKIRGAEQRKELVRAIKRAVSEKLELTPDEVLIVPPRTIPKTTSGKVQRPLCRQLYLHERGKSGRALGN